MPKLICRGTLIRFVDLRYDEKSKTSYTKLNLTAAWSKPVCVEMGWGEPPASFSMAKLDGDFPANVLILTPDGDLKKHEIQLNAKEIGGFEVHRVKEGESTTNELRFQIVSADPDAAAKLHEYLKVIGKGTAQLRVNYEQQAELEEQATPDRQGRLISPQQAEDTKEADKDAPALASAQVMGGTHQRGTRSKKTHGSEVN